MELGLKSRLTPGCVYVTNPPYVTEFTNTPIDLVPSDDALAKNLVGCEVGSVLFSEDKVDWENHKNQEVSQDVKWNF